MSNSTQIRAAMYPRISLDRNMDGLAIDRQHSVCRQIAEDRGRQVVDEYVDQSKTATDKTKCSPAYDRMVHDYAVGRFDAIICWDLIPKSLPHLSKHSRALAIERNERREAEGMNLRPVLEDGSWSSSTVLGILRNPRYASYSVCTDRNTCAKNKRRNWHAQILRDEHGDPVMGQ